MTTAATFPKYLGRVLKALEKGEFDHSLPECPFKGKFESAIIRSLGVIQNRLSAAAALEISQDLAAEVCHAASIGDYSQVVAVKGDKDQLGNAINRMIGNLRDVVSQANAIARGDYSADIAPRSDADELGIALNEMTKTLRDVVQITEAVSVGEFSGSIKIKSDNDLLSYAINQMIVNVREATVQQQAIVAASLDPMITIDAWGLVQSASDSVERVFGYTVEEVVGQNITMLMPEPYRSEHDGYLKKYQETGQSNLLGVTREFVARRKNGEQFPCEVSVSRVDLPDQDEPLFAGTIRDISERKKKRKNSAIRPTPSLSKP